MAHSDPFADHGGVLVRKVDHATVLDVGMGSDADGLDVGPENSLKPDARVFSEGDIPDHGGVGGNERGWVDAGRYFQMPLESVGFNHGKGWAGGGRGAGLAAERVAGFAT